MKRIIHIVNKGGNSLYYSGNLIKWSGHKSGAKVFDQWEDMLAAFKASSDLVREAYDWYFEVVK